MSYQPPLYQHSQPATWLLILLFAIIGIIVVPTFITVNEEPLSSVANITLISVLVIFLITILLFYSLKVTITNKDLKIAFGIGLIRKAYQLQDIKACKTVENPWYYGLGIHFIGTGWIYNVSGSKGIEIEMKNGKKNRIGSDEPEKLAAELQKLIK